MQGDKERTRRGLRWREILAGAATALLLLPMPVYAALNFSNLGWTNSYSTFTGGDPTNNLSFGTLPGPPYGLQVSFNEPTSYSNSTGTLTYTSTGITGTGKLHGTWKVDGSNSLDAIYHLTAGTITVTVGVSPSTNDQFSGSYTKNNPPPNSGWANSATQYKSPVVIVTFKFTNATFSVGSTPINMTLTSP